MGADCPNGHGRHNIVVQITADHSDPKHSSDVVAQKLACGCVVGGEGYEQFKAAAAQIDTERSAAIRKIDSEARKKKAAAYQGFVTQRGEGHAE